VLFGGTGHAAPPIHLELSSSGAVLDLVAVGGAVAIAWALPRIRTFRARRSSAVWAAVCRLHDGSIGDAATWVTIGTAAFAAVLVASGH